MTTSTTTPDLTLNACQRWRRGRESWRPGAEPIDPSRYEVEPIVESVARDFVVSHHYSGSYPAASVRVGLFRRSLGFRRELAGVAVFSTPAQAAAIPFWTGTDAGLELGRFVLVDEVEGNGETWFLSRALAVLQAERPALRAVLSYSDPMGRTSADGRVVTPGHVGTIYQAANARHVGRARAEWRFLDRDGRELSRRARSKIRNDERGAAGAYERFLEQGAPPRRPFEDGPTYIARALAEGVASGAFRRVRHPGNLAYVFGLGAARKATLEALPHPALPYPKAATHRVAA